MFAEALDDQPVQAPVDVPVHVARVVPRRVGPDVDELQARAVARAAPVAGNAPVEEARGL